MPCFNSAQFVADAINSVTNQSYKNWELIVVDDNSTDDTVRVVSAFEKKIEKLSSSSVHQIAELQAQEIMHWILHREISLLFLIVMICGIKTF